MGIALSFLTAEVALGIVACAADRPWWLVAILLHEALHASPRVNQEVFAREKLENLRQVNRADHEFGRDIAVELSVLFVAEDHHKPHQIINLEAHERAEQQIVIELLHQLPFRARRLEGAQWKKYAAGASIADLRGLLGFLERKSTITDQANHRKIAA